LAVLITKQDKEDDRVMNCGYVDKSQIFLCHSATVICTTSI